MPLPMVALPCGSRSTSSTRRPACASAAARLTLVVVLPTPPFWFTTAKTRGTLSLQAPQRQMARRVEQRHAQLDELRAPRVAGRRAGHRGEHAAGPHEVAAAGD